MPKTTILPFGARLTGCTVRPSERLRSIRSGERTVCLAPLSSDRFSSAGINIVDFLLGERPHNAGRVSSGNGKRRDVRGHYRARSDHRSVTDSDARQNATIKSKPHIRSDPHRPGTRLPLEAAAFQQDRKSTRLNSSHGYISYAVF